MPKTEDSHSAGFRMKEGYLAGKIAIFFRGMCEKM